MTSSIGSSVATGLDTITKQFDTGTIAPVSYKFNFSEYGEGWEGVISLGLLSAPGQETEKKVAKYFVEVKVFSPTSRADSSQWISMGSIEKVKGDLEDKETTIKKIIDSLEGGVINLKRDIP